MRRSKHQRVIQRVGKGADADSIDGCVNIRLSMRQMQGTKHYVIDFRFWAIYIRVAVRHLIEMAVPGGAIMHLGSK